MLGFPTYLTTEALKQFSWSISLTQFPWVFCQETLIYTVSILGLFLEPPYAEEASMRFSNQWNSLIFF